MSTRRFLTAVVGAAAIALPAQAGVFSDAFQGLRYITQPSGGPLFQGPNGSLVNGQRLGLTRIQPNAFGDGWRLEMNRNFGNDSLGRPEIMDFGNFEVELQGGMSMDAGFTRRGIPTANLSFNVANLNYSIRGKSGAQDIELSGVLNGAQSVEINPLGFYETQINFSNFNASIAGNGLLIEGEDSTNFDIGPITVRGNLYVDLLALALANFGIDTTPLTQLFPQSPIDRIIGDLVGDVEKMSTARMLGINDSAFYVGGAGVDGLGSSGSGGFSSIPEPASLLLLAGGSLFLFRRR